MNVVLSYIAFADFGMGLASTNFASEAFAKGDVEEEGRIVRAAALVSLITSGLMAIGLVSGARLLVVDILLVPEHLQQVAIVATYITSVTFVARVLSSVLNSPQLSRLRMDLNSSINSIFNVLQLVAVPIVIYLGGGLIGAVLVVMIASVACLVAHTFVSSRLLSRLFQLQIGLGVLGPLLRSGSTIFIALVAGVVLANIEKFVLTRYTSVTVFAYYSVAFTLANMVTLFSASLTQTLVPAFSQLYFSGHRAELQHLFSRTMIMNLAAYAPGAFVLSLIARSFFASWAGPEFGQESTEPFYILLVGLLFSFSASVSGAMIIAARKTGASAIMYWLELVPYVLIVVLFTIRWGAAGAAAAWSARIMFEAIVLIVIVRKKIDISVVFSDKRFLYLAASVLPFLLSLSVSVAVPMVIWVQIVLAAMALAIYSAVVWTKVMSSDEKSYLLRLAKLSLSRNN
jgi:O-antigen/teichoic acid export membrane protein